MSGNSSFNISSSNSDNFWFISGNEIGFSFEAALLSPRPIINLFLESATLFSSKYLDVKQNIPLQFVGNFSILTPFGNVIIYLSEAP